MPYFKNNNINTLFIHIPKTGGTSVENYLSKKYNIPLNLKSLWGGLDERFKKYNLNLKNSTQHLTLGAILNKKFLFNIDMNNLKIITIVRNPYNRIISELFYNNKININSTKKEVYNILLDILKEYIKNEYICDNHIKPQYLFLLNNEIKDIQILHTENLTNEMHKLGYLDFDLNHNANKEKLNYFDYLNINSIRLINEFYKYDFINFKYKMINTNKTV
jgi:hypothetical protein